MLEYSVLAQRLFLSLCPQWFIKWLMKENIEKYFFSETISEIMYVGLVDIMLSDSPWSYRLYWVWKVYTYDW